MARHGKPSRVTCMTMADHATPCCTRSDDVNHAGMCKMQLRCEGGLEQMKYTLWLCGLVPSAWLRGCLVQCWDSPLDRSFMAGVRSEVGEGWKHRGNDGMHRNPQTRARADACMRTDKQTPMHEADWDARGHASAYIHICIHGRTRALCEHETQCTKMYCDGDRGAREGAHTGT